MNSADQTARFLNALMVNQIVQVFENAQRPLEGERLKRVTRLSNKYLLILLYKLKSIDTEDNASRLAAIDETCQNYWNDHYIATVNKEKVKSTLT